MISQIYIDVVMFGGLSSKMVRHSFPIQYEFEMSLACEFTYFLDFQVKQIKYGIFLS